MRCIVTAGPTYEPLDRVRRLTNHSTGTLGTGLANRLALAGHDVLLMRGQLSSAAPPIQAVQVMDFGQTTDLASRLLDRATDDRILLCHAAAVGDFTFGQVFERDAGGKLTPLYGGKLSTRSGTVLAELKPTPKLLPNLRDWFPNAVIVGWKYEVDGNREDVILKCRAQIEECRSDLSVANGPAYGSGFGLVSRDGTRELPGVEELYAELLRLATGGRN